MEWATLQHLDLRHVGRSSKPFQPHAASFHPTQAIVAVAIGTYIMEFDAYTGSKIASIDVGAPVVRMSYIPTGGNAVVAILEDCTIRSCDFDSEQTCVLHSPEKRMEQISSDTEVHLALTPLQPIVFFGFHRRMSVTVVGTVEGGRAPTKIKTDLKKPIVNLACHPRLPVLYVAYADGLIRAYNIHTYAVHYTLQLDNTIRLIGAGAFAFHPTLEWVFIGDRRGTLLAWDVSTERPSMIGIIQVGSQPITSIAWMSKVRLLVTLSRDGALQVWKTRVILNPNRPPMQANFFEPAAIESLDIPRILSQQGGEAVYPLPRIKSIEIHSKLNLAALLFANMAGGENQKNRAMYTREGRKQLFAVLQGARGSSASVLKEKLSSLGSSGILADHQLQAQLQEQHLKGQNHLTISDIARKAFLYSHFMEEHAKSTPISRLPLITVLDSKHHLKDLPVCQPFHLELNFFNKENRVLYYPVRAFYLEGLNLMAYNLCSGVDNIYKKLYTSIPGNVELHPKYLLYSKKQHLFLVVYKLSGTTHEVVLYWENTDSLSANSKASTVKGKDAAFIGPNENQFAILDEDKTGLGLYILPGGASQQVDEKNGAEDQGQSVDVNVGSVKGPMEFLFETQVDRIFSTPIESTMMFATHGDQIGLAKLVQGYRVSNANGHYIPTQGEGRKSIKLKINEIVLQIHWQETLRGYVAGILTTQRVLIVSADLDILSSSSTKFDKGLPSFRSLLWVGPALLFSTATAISVLGWDGRVRTILSISMPNSVLVGALNDRLLLANPTEVTPKQKKAVEIKSCLVGLLEPLLIGFATMQESFEQKLDLSEILYQITSRFDSLRITPRSLDILSRGSPVCGDLAVSLSQSGPQFTQVLRGIYAINALRFSIALSVLKDEFLRSRDYPQCPPTSHLFQRFRQLGYACIKYGQFDSAKETFEVIADYESMLDLFICHLNPSAMRRLAQNLEEEGADSELRRYCERILRVRSTGWTQGIFANFAAESMVPKGPEWGGGNWEIKTPANLKAIPQWELAAEVMPYMKTDEGTIPSIVTDHIGIYLGLIKGRGNVVEVREGSLVKALKPVATDARANALHVPLGTSMSNKSKVVAEGDSLLGLETLTKQPVGTSAADEQAKAEEEFKKSLYGTADGSSSDEEENSKAKKIRIRIREKPVESTTVDVNKIKEATKQFKLGDGLGPPISRTKSLPIREERSIQISVLNYRRDGTPFWILFHMCPVFSREDGRVIHFVGVQVPILRRQRCSASGFGRNGVNLCEDGCGFRESLLGSCRREVCSDSVVELGHVLDMNLGIDSDDREIEVKECCEASDLEKQRATTSINSILSVLSHYSELTGRLVCGKRCCLPGMGLLGSLNIPLGRIKQSFVLTDPNFPDMPIVYASDAFLNLTGYARHEVLGRNCRFLSGEDTDLSAIFQIKQSIQAEQACTVRILNYRKDKSSFWNLLHISPVRNASGKIAYYVGVQTDESRKKEDEHGLTPDSRQLSLGVVGAVRVAVRSLSMGAAGSSSTSASMS